MGPLRASEAVALTLIVFAVAMFVSFLVFGDNGSNSGETLLPASQPTVEPTVTPAVAGASEPPEEGEATAPGAEPLDREDQAGAADSAGADPTDSAPDATPTPPAAGAGQTVPK